MKSASAISSSSGTSRTPSWAARPAWTNGSYAMTFIPKALSRCATSTPILPRPTMPRVFSNSSMPEYLLRFHSPRA